ncbi:unnamed protein product [Ceratitis capitata]|uniref:(Mediterranean fruit fly) hypothetical protein n=1 Tax=Ceratitis capitata TaxID=7213 RepID=A0A811VAK5_CERCA|nr:unnamed protein product [Ceratitis capitata]
MHAVKLSCFTSLYAILSPNWPEICHYLTAHGCCAKAFSLNYTISAAFILLMRNKRTFSNFVIHSKHPGRPTVDRCCVILHSTSLRHFNQLKIKRLSHIQYHLCSNS